jgi:hypothetical protein
MKHLLMDPAFPDLVGQAVAPEPEQPRRGPCPCANDNGGAGDDFADPLLVMLGKLEVATTRLW